MRRCSVWLAWIVGCTAPVEGTVGSEVPSPDTPVPSRWFLDADGDGFGAPGTEVQAPDQPLRHVDNQGDCDDTDASIYPNAPEVRGDGIDQSCSGGDATCESLPTYPGDLVLRGGSAEGDLVLFCQEFSGVHGIVTVEETRLTSLDPLRCVCTVGGLELIDNRHLQDASALADLAFEGDPTRLVVRGSPDVTEISVELPGAVEQLSLSDCAALEQLEIRGPASVGSLELVGLPLLDGWESRRFPALVNVGELTIDWVPMSTLEPFGAVRTIDGLVLRDTDVSSLAGLGALVSLRQLTVHRTPLPDLAALGGVIALERLEVQGEPSPTSLAGAEGVVFLEALDLRGSQLRSLRALGSLETIDGSVHIVGNPDLHTLEGLEQVRHITGHLTITGNDLLYDITALHGAKVDGVVALQGDLLTPTSVQDFYAALDANRAR